MKSKRIIRLKEVLKLTGLSKSTLLRLEKRAQFPQKIQISKRCVGWHYDEIIQWIENKGGRHE